MFMLAAIKKHRKITTLVFGIVLVVGSVGWLLIYHGNSTLPTDKLPENEHSPKRSSFQHEIKGVSYNGIHQGKKTISIKADKFRVQNKKIGVLRFGLMREAKFENAQIHIYGKKRLPNGMPFGGLTSHEKIGLHNKNNKQIPPEKMELSFEEAFSKSLIAALPIKGVRSIIMKPVEMVIHDDREAVVSQINAREAVVRPKKNDILFTGNVKMVSGDSVLFTERLRLLPKKSIVKVDGKFKLSSIEGKRKGQEMTATLYLRPLDL